MPRMINVSNSAVLLIFIILSACAPTDPTQEIGLSEGGPEVLSLHKCDENISPPVLISPGQIVVDPAGPVTYEWDFQFCIPDHVSLRVFEVTLLPGPNLIQ